MSIWGKIVGGAAGLITAGPLGALVGAGLGHAIDRSLEDSGAAKQDTALTKITFTIGVVALAAKMAKADGRVTGSEIQAFKRLFQVPASEQRNVERVFNLARQDTAGFEAYARQIAKLFQARAAVLEDLLDALFTIACADGKLHPEEIAYLRRVAEIFGFDEAAFDCVKARHLGEDEASPYAVLGVPRDMPSAQIKAAYRALVRDNHPDKLMAEGVPEEFMKVATDRLAAINAAYDKIRAERGLE
ncbi:MAG: TerB family tellurite resistance protein [Sphingomonadales bacterium]